MAAAIAIHVCPVIPDEASLNKNVDNRAISQYQL
jgi:hypothetical protein